MHPSQGVDFRSSHPKRMKPQVSHKIFQSSKMLFGMFGIIHVLDIRIIEIGIYKENVLIFNNYFLGNYIISN